MAREPVNEQDAKMQSDAATVLEKAIDPVLGQHGVVAIIAIAVVKAPSGGYIGANALVTNQYDAPLFLPIAMADVYQAIERLGPAKFLEAIDKGVELEIAPSGTDTH